MEEKRQKIICGLKKASDRGNIEDKDLEEKADKMLAYMDAILEKNQQINLTRIVDPDEFVEKHILDSLEVLLVDEFKSAKRILDVGTGAGFPGVILAIACPDKDFLLLDARQKKLKVIDQIAAGLGISNVETQHGRAEELARMDSYNKAFDVVVSRAVSDIKKLAGWTMPFLRPGGTAVYHKGPSLDDEMKEGERYLRRKGAVHWRRLPSSLTDQDHILLVVTKKG